MCVRVVYVPLGMKLGVSKNLPREPGRATKREFYVEENDLH